MLVTIFLPTGSKCFFWTSSVTRFAMVSCSGVLKKIAERYSEDRLCQRKHVNRRVFVLTRACVRSLSVGGGRIVCSVKVFYVAERCQSTYIPTAPIRMFTHRQVHHTIPCWDQIQSSAPQHVPSLQCTQSCSPAPCPPVLPHLCLLCILQQS